MIVERSTDPHELNRLANDPDIYPWVKGWIVGHLDLSSAVADRSNVLLVGPGGAVLFVFRMTGIYEAHTLMTKAARGAGTLALVRDAVWWMFTRTAAIELISKAPQGNLGALTLLRLVRAHPEFTTEGGWVKDSDPIPATMFSLSIQDWIRTAPGLAARGQWLYDLLASEYVKQGREPQKRTNAAHDCHIGACLEMLTSGQPDKAVVFGNRFDAMTGFGRMTVVSYRPLTVDIGDAFLTVREDGTVWVPSLK